MVIEPYSSDHRIADVEVITAQFDLPGPPIPVGHDRIGSREYVFVRLTTEAGVTGSAYALTRGAPVENVVANQIAALVEGRDALSIPAIWQEFSRRMLMLGTEGVPLRAMSLVDVCLWDIKAQIANLPLWRLLGGARQSAPTLLVDLYPTGDEEPAAVVQSLEDLVRDGYGLFKLHCGGATEWVTEVLAIAEESYGRRARWVLDAGMEREDPTTAIASIREWERFGPAWIEDPFRAEHVDWIRTVREAVRVPIGAGDEVASLLRIRELVDYGAVDLVRLDALVHGGITGFSTLAEYARLRGCRVSPHVYPEVHQHCVAALPGVRHLEVFAPKTQFDCAEKFVAQGSLPTIESGRMSAPERPGLGLSIDWDAVTQRRSVNRCARAVPTTAMGNLVCGQGDLGCSPPSRGP